MNRQKRGFTLIELLTVIAILTLLIAILIPSLTSARRSAKANVCLAGLKGIGNAFSVYLNEYGDQFPPFRLKALSPASEEAYINEYGRHSPRWQWFLETDSGAVIDPSPFQFAIRSTGYFYDGTIPRSGDGGSGTTMSHEVFTCPSLVDTRFQLDIRDGAYGYNYQYLGNTRQDTNPLRWDNFSVGLHRLTSPSNTVVVADSRGAGREHGRHSYTLDPPRLAVEEDAVRFGPDPSHYDSAAQTGDVEPGRDVEVYAYSPVAPRHNNKGNVLFVDTHAEAKSLVALGYQVEDGTLHSGIPTGTPIGVLDPSEGTYTATNRLWTGDNQDPLAVEHQRTPERP